MTDVVPPSRPPGRPRSERAERAIVEATLDLLAEEPGVAGVSIEAVAARAGVGKTTIYRRWPNKEALIVDALASLKAPMPEMRGGTVREELLAIARVFTQERSRRHARCVWNVLGGAEKHPELLKQYQAQVLAPRRRALRAVLRHGVETGELRADMDFDTAAYMFVGALTLPLRSMAPIDDVPDDLGERVVDSLLNGLIPR